MSNQIYHNKWHGFNHHTIHTPGFPDSSTDPVASRDYPFKGIFYNFIRGKGFSIKDVTITSTGSGYTTEPLLQLSAKNAATGVVINPGLFRAKLNTIKKTITGVEVIDGGNYTGKVFLGVKPAQGDNIVRTAIFALSSDFYSYNSNSFGWWFYSSLTQNNSGYWNLWRSVETTVTTYSGFWELGYQGYTNLIANSSYWESVYSTVSSLSSEIYYNGLGGTGWNIALSSITHRLNTSAINIQQKVAVPFKLQENPDRTLTWVTTAQTVYVNLTGNYELSANNVFEAKKGGKYTMWLYVDKCPEEKANVVFNKDTYVIRRKRLNDSFQTTNNVVVLNANHITRIDFVYDGVKMLGRSTDYYVDLPTTDDTYYKGTGITFYDLSFRKRNPVQVNAFPFDIIDQSKLYFKNGTGTLIEKKNLDNPLSLYTAGTGIKIRYFGANNKYLSFNLYGAEWPSELYLTKYPAVTSSFDRVIGLSGGDWLTPQYGYNLIASPLSGDVPPSIVVKFPSNYYELTPSNIITLKQCTSSYTIQICSGKDRYIDNLSLNGANLIKTPLKFNNQFQPFNFLNEETATITFTRIQEDQEIEVYYNQQPVRNIPNNLLWFNSMDDTLFKPNTVNVEEWVSNTPSNTFKLIQPTNNNRPSLTVDGSLRGVYLKGDDFLYLNDPLLTLSGTDINSETWFTKTPFSTVTIVQFDSLPTGPTCLWWIGNNDYTGYGLQVRGSSLYTRPGITKSEKVGNFTLQTGKKYVITTIFDGSTERILINNRSALTTSKRGIYQRTASSHNNTDYSLTMGKLPGVNSGYTDLRLYEFMMFKKALTTGEINRLNLFLIEKIEGYK